MRSVIALRLPLLILAALGCSSGSTSETGSADAGLKVAATEPVALVRSHAAFADRLATATLTRGKDGFTVESGPRAALRAVFPEVSQGAVRMVNGPSSIAVTPLDLARVPASVEGSTLVYRDVAAATDLVLSPSKGGVEELRVLRDARAPTTFRWKVEPPAGGSVRMGNTGVEVLDEKGVLVAAAERPWALDASGTRRDLATKLEGDTLVATLATDELSFPIVVDPTWTAVGNMRTVRYAPVLIPLNDGKVVVIPNDTAPWMDLFDPATNTWATGADLPPDIPNGGSEPSWTDVNAIKMADGNVLVVHASATTYRRFNYPAKTWTTYANAQNTACNPCSLARASDGKIYKFNSSGSFVSPEVFNPASPGWTNLATTTLSGSGLSNVAVVSGDRMIMIDQDIGQTPRLYNPATNTWSTLASGVKHTNAQFITLADGRVMMLGVPWGAGSPPPVAKIWNPTTDTWSTTYNYVRSRLNPGLVRLTNNRIMVIGGKRIIGASTEWYDDAEIWDPAFNAWTLLDPMGITGREKPGVAPLPNSGVLVAGGTGFMGPSSAAARFAAIADGASCTPPAFPVTCNALYCVDGVCCTASSCPGGTCAAPAVAGRAAGTCAKNLGSSCTANSDCASGFCTDGVCCDKACGGQCEACNLPPSPGTCRPTMGAPIAPRTACTGAGVGSVCGPSCNGVDATKCNYAAAGTVACGIASCSAGTEVRAGTCNGSGTCAVTTAACDPYVCGPTTCKTSCASAGDCLAGYYCDASKCLPKVGLGASCTATSMCPSGLFCTDGVCCGVESCGSGSSCSAGPKKGECVKLTAAKCTTGAECATGFCVDGVCCNRACDGQCEACNLSSNPGVCSPVLGAPVGARAACGGPGAGTKCEATCNGTDASKCNYAAAGTIACGTDSCAAGTETKAGTCDGGGGCATTTAKCDAYTCGATACKRSCAVEADCAAGHYCAGDKCLPKVGLGSSCTATSMCPSGLLCTDGVCCGVASCGEGSSCSAGAKKGVCVKIDGTSCGGDAECASNHCIDGVCCNRACDGQCEACDIPATKGTCSPVVGAPHGSRKACASDASDVCKARTCDGKNSTACDGYASGATVQCKPASCDGAKLIPKSSCDGAGSCVTPPVASCGKYACDPATIACRADCKSGSDCAEGFSCIAGVCAEGARCTEDRLGSIGTDGATVPCAPYRCGTDGKCQQKCATSDDCAGGTLCDTAAGGVCVQPSSGGGDEGGCAMGSKPNAKVPGSLFLLMALAGLRRRRAR